MGATASSIDTKYLVSFAQNFKTLNILLKTLYYAIIKCHRMSPNIADNQYFAVICPSLNVELYRATNEPIAFTSLI